MKKIIILSLMLACQSLHAAPASKASAPAAKATQTSKAPAKKAEKAKPAADKKAAKPEAKKTAEPKKKAEPVKAKKDKTSEKKPALAKADKRKAVETKKAVAQKSEKSHDKAAAKNKNDKKVAAAKDKKHAPAKTRDVAANGISSARSTLLNHGKKFIGTPYVWGGTSPKGFDCSGLVHYLYQKQGVSIPRNSREQFSRLPVASNPQPGDLVFFRRNGTINHVGLYLGGGKMLHAPQTGAKVRIEDMGRPNWKRRYAGARRALKGEKIVIAANRVTATSKNKEPNEKRLAKRAPNSKDKASGKDSKAKVAAVVKKSKVVTARR